MSINKDGHVIEPSMLVLCSDVIELIEGYQKGLDPDEFFFGAEYESKYDRYNGHYQKAAKNLRKFNRRTLSN